MAADPLDEIRHAIGEKQSADELQQVDVPWQLGHRGSLSVDPYARRIVQARNAVSSSQALSSPEGARMEGCVAKGLYLSHDGRVVVAYATRRIQFSLAQYKANSYKPACDKPSG